MFKTLASNMWLLTYCRCERWAGRRELPAEEGMVCLPCTVMFIIGVLHRFILMCSVAHLSVVYTNLVSIVLRHGTPYKCNVENVAQEVACVVHCFMISYLIHCCRTTTHTHHIPCDCITMYRSPKFCSSFSCHHDIL